jgi:hypothetical protein
MPEIDQTSKDEVKEGEEQKVTLNGIEMTVEEANALIEAGREMKELKEQNPNVDFKTMAPEFTKRSQRLAEFEKTPEKTADEQLTEAEEKERKQIDALVDHPYYKKRREEEDSKKEAKIKEDFKLEKELESLESQLDGKDGRPKFERAEVIEFGKANGIFNLRAAYNQMHETALDEWKMKELLKRKPKTPYVEKGGTGGGATPPEAKPAGDFKDAERNALARTSDDSDD